MFRYGLITNLAVTSLELCATVRGTAPRGDIEIGTYKSGGTVVSEVRDQKITIAPMACFVFSQKGNWPVGCKVVLVIHEPKGQKTF